MYTTLFLEYKYYSFFFLSFFLSGIICSASLFTIKPASLPACRRYVCIDTTGLVWYWNLSGKK